MAALNPRANEIFLATLEIDTPAARQAHLNSACGGDANLRAEVEALLAAHESSTDLLEKTVDSHPGPPKPDATGEFTPEPEPRQHRHPNGTVEFRADVDSGLIVAGRYTLLEKIGEGGMGEVWVAKQSEPVKRKVALKLIKAGMDSRSVVQRFEQERQALALMDHPNIAKVLDGGLTSDRRPYFVMELVNGLPLNRFCDEMKLGIRERLKLFVPICQAVQHAHQKSIVHRDLKPSNILVTMIDGRPVPKVIDFGVAKATAGKLTDESMATHFGAVVGTLEYMAPEQAGFSGGDIDTRADIYSLGVVLYELLTGLHPIDTKRLKKAALDEMIRVIKEEEPSKPSTRLSFDASLPSLAASRQIEPKRLTAMLRGELDWVVMKCLEKQRDRRYETASGLARDIERYLADEVVEARPPSAGYRVKKFVRRNKGQVIAASLVLLALLAGMTGTTWGLIEARRQEKEAKRQGEIARAETVEKEKARQAEAERAEGERRAKLEAQAAREKAEQNAQIAGTQATLALNTIQSLISQATEKLQGPGLFEIRQGLMEVALQNVSKVADVYDKVPSSKEATTMAALVELGGIFRQLGRADKSSKLFLTALDIAKERIKVKKGSDASRRNLALVYSNLGATAEELNRDMNAALDYQLKALALLEDIDEKPMLADSPMPRATIRASLSETLKLVGVMYYRLGKLNEAVPYFHKSYNLARELAEAQPNNSGLQVNLTKAALALGSTSFRTGDRTRAETYLAEARERALKLLAGRPNDIFAKINLADVLYMTGETYFFAGKLPEARAEMKESLKLYDEIAKADPQNVYYQRNLSKAHYRLGNLDLLAQKPDEARSHFDVALKIRAAQAAISKENDRRQMELMLAQAQAGLVDASMATADRLAAGSKVDPELRMDLARCYAIASRTMLGREPERATTLQVKAMEALRAAVANGYRDRGYLQGEPDFIPLRGRNDFKALLDEISAPKR